MPSGEGAGGLGVGLQRGPAAARGARRAVTASLLRSLRAPSRAWADAGTPLSRRSLALADDAAFRERARLLAALERRRWLDSYMQKLLLLDAP